MKPMFSSIKWMALPCLAIAPIAIALASAEQWSSDFSLQGNGPSALSISPASAPSDQYSSAFSGALASPGDPLAEEPSGRAPLEDSSLTAPSPIAASSTASLSISPQSSLSTRNIAGPDEAGINTSQGFNCENPQYQQEMNYCAQLAYQEADEALNEAYNQLLETLTATRRENLVAAELAWIAYRDATCEFERSRYEGGSIAPLIYYSCMTQLTQEQTLRLENYLQGN